MWRSDRLRQLRGQERAAFYRYRRLRTLVEAGTYQPATRVEMESAKRGWEEALALLHSTAQGTGNRAGDAPQMDKRQAASTTDPRTEEELR